MMLALDDKSSSKSIVNKQCVNEDFETQVAASPRRPPMVSTPEIGDPVHDLNLADQ